MARIVVAGTFDSKAEPFGQLVEALRAEGEDPVVIDTGVFPGDPSVDFPAHVVARRAGRSHADLPALGRAGAVGIMASGAADILAGLHERGEVGALVCMGGSNAATVFSQLVPVLPLGIPKILMATSVAGDTRPMIGATDVIMLYPVVDVDGHNSILHSMIRRLARTAVAVKTGETFRKRVRPRKAVALSMYGVTTPCVQLVSKKIEEAGLDAYVFHANGTGGRSIEAFAAQGLVDGVVDATLSELGNEILGGLFPAGSDRLQGAAASGIPQVIAPGAIDMIAFGPRPTVPERFSGHRILAHNDLVTLVRTTPEECHAIGACVAERLGNPKAATRICIPLGGTSMLDRDGEGFWDPDAVRAFADGLAAGRGSGIEVVHSRYNINDPEFAALLFRELQGVMAAGSPMNEGNGTVSKEGEEDPT